MSRVYESKPRERVADHTKFRLRLKNRDISDVQNDLQSIQPEFLLFLQQLDTLRVTSPHSEKTFSRTRCEFDPSFVGETITISTKEGKSTLETTYIVQRHIVWNPPEEPRSEGVSSSEVMVAFPVKETSPIIKTQKAFAFLPIRDFTFQVSLRRFYTAEKKHRIRPVD